MLYCLSVLSQLCIFDLSISLSESAWYGGWGWEVMELCPHISFPSFSSCLG